MKLVIQAFIASVIIHLVYIVCTIGIGYIKTKFYKPDISGSWEKVDYLQNEVAFGMVISPFFFVFSLVGIAIICGIIIYLYKNFIRKRVF
ncbi:hypothetical protein [Psychrobacillus sp. OK032]|uniref:hypothetical protein n=1 Tax=Psychrobacillus sp. OK032 TaxID=1884358 RepID=UPI0008BE3C25|nr:hypothetical protein [Psychrobacillus sp. OK032]SES07506.1 hypothetical protein SAMN05518872_10433 [Psychrobacillus sp. OK032]